MARWGTWSSTSAGDYVAEVAPLRGRGYTHCLTNPVVSLSEGVGGWVEISDWYEDEDASPQEEGEEERETDRIAGGVRRGSGSPGFAAPVVLQGAPSAC